jgi:hypothetical protein
MKSTMQLASLMLIAACSASCPRPAVQQAAVYVDRLGRQCQKVGFDGSTEFTICRDEKVFDIDVVDRSGRYVALAVGTQPFRLEAVDEVDADAHVDGISLWVADDGAATLRRVCRDCEGPVKECSLPASSK